MSANRTVEKPRSELVIRATDDRRTIVQELNELWRYRGLIKVLVRRELRLRYKNSVLGVGWSLIAPLVQVFVLTLALYILGTGPNSMSAYILCAYVPWMFFQTGIFDSSAILLSQEGLMKKVYFPREIPVIATVTANFIHFLISLGVFVVYRWVVTPILHGWPGLPPPVVFWLPAIIVTEFILVLGISFFVSAWNVFFEDVKFIVTMVVNLLFYLVPIIYFAENIMSSTRIPERYRWWLYHLYLANPIAWIITGFKQTLFGVQNIAPKGHAAITSAPFDLRYFAIAFMSSLAILVCGYLYFNARKWKFTERP